MAFSSSKATALRQVLQVRVQISSIGAVALVMRASFRARASYAEEAAGKARELTRANTSRLAYERTSGTDLPKAEIRPFRCQRTPDEEREAGSAGAACHSALSVEMKCVSTPKKL